MSNINRRDFIKKAAVVTAAGSAGILAACGNKEETAANGAPAVQTGKTYHWKMVTTWPPKFPALGEGADLFAKWVDEMSGGRLKIRVYGGGELVPPLEAFDSVSQGAAEMGHGAAYYWAGKSPAAQFFCAVPFGMNAQQMNAWLIAGGGMQLWEELYAQFNLVPFPCGNTGVQMGGWFRKKIDSMADIKGLKMRIPGLGGKVISKAGGSAVLSAGGEIFTNLERNVIDATEWIGPYHDYLMGFPKVAAYYYYPGWQEPSAVLEMFVNKTAFDGLPTDLQNIIRAAAMRANSWILAEFESKNNQYLQKILTEFDTKLLKFPDDVLAGLKNFSDEAIAEVLENDPFSQKVYQSYQNFRKQIAKWSAISEKVYYSDLGEL
ncbi:MAG: TRAP transporter substrate-binding protein DctP [Calditrichaeota bacterium]|nr:TRAP transporter substrate-binding protein DctP [Calditrichota bacterium]